MKKEQILQVFEKFESEIHKREYSQFAIDFIQNHYSDYQDGIDNGLFGDSSQYQKDFVLALCYTIDTVLEIINPDLADVNLFEQMREELQLIY